MSTDLTTGASAGVIAAALIGLIEAVKVMARGLSARRNGRNGGATLVMDQVLYQQAEAIRAAVQDLQAAHQRLADVLDRLNAGVDCLCDKFSNVGTLMDDIARRGCGNRTLLERIERALTDGHGGNGDGGAG